MEFFSALLQTVVTAWTAVVLAVASLFGAFSVTPLPAPVAEIPSSIEQIATTTEQTPATTTAAAVTPEEATPPEPTTPVAQQTKNPSSPPVATKTESQVNSETRAALVNILCTTRGGGLVRPISGSGVLIDNRGIILTNAHIGQFFLLRDYPTADNIDCVVRVGSPAESRYRATLLYLPPQWIADNKEQLTASQATGTGERDYAFLLITSTTNPSGTLPTSFPHVTLTTNEPGLGSAMLLASYPAGFLSGEIIAKSLYASSALASVIKLFSFDGSANIDLISIGGTVVSQAGSSGGAVVHRENGALSGIIATASVAERTDERDLRAVTLAHIHRDLLAAGKGGLAGLLLRDAPAEAAEFNSKVAPGLTAALEAVLNGQ